MTGKDSYSALVESPVTDGNDRQPVVTTQTTLGVERKIMVELTWWSNVVGVGGDVGVKPN